MLLDKSVIQSANTRHTTHRKGKMDATANLDCKTVRIFVYSSTSEQSNKRSGMRLKTESETGERRFFFSLASHARRACEARALRARKTLTPRFTDFFTDFEKKTDCFAVYSKLQLSISEASRRPWGRNECVTNEPQRTSVGRLLCVQIQRISWA